MDIQPQAVPIFPLPDQEQAIALQIVCDYLTQAGTQAATALLGCPKIDGATTLLEAAAQAGIAVPTGCERGLCRACVTPKLAGTVNLETDAAPQERITVCTAMACSDVELDL